ncbi:MAG: FtsW/RodA/SpoVE family cell cycle protein [Bacteroidales bacterium]|nr:FtsW/RodA/SpoVE family cell cycle protein [Bacteroidales bacterium]
MNTSASNNQHSTLNTRHSSLLRGDKIMWSVYFLFIIISIVEVFSAMGKEVVNNNFLPLLLRHTIFLLIGFICCYIFHRTDYRKITRWLTFLLYLSIALTCVPYLMAALNSETLSTARWIRLHLPFLNLQFQPSEIAKYAVLLYICSVMAANQERIETKEIFFKALFPLLLVCMTVFWSNFSTTVLIFVTGFLIMRIGGINKRYLYLTLLILVGLLGMLLLIAKLNPEFASKIGRLATIVSRTEGHTSADYSEITQANQALTAVATGGLLGRGIGNSIQSRFLEEGHNDFIFSIILEEGGIWLGGLIIFLYVILLYRMFKAARNIDGYFGSMACLAIGILITLQTLINMSVAVGLIPVTGQTLPFISYGGTSFIFASIFLGMIINITISSEQSSISKEKIKPPTVSEEQQEIEINDNE